MNIKTEIIMAMHFARVRYAMLFPASKMTDRRRMTLAGFLGWRDFYQDRDGCWCGKSGYLSSGPSSGIWGGLPSDSDLLKEVREEWAERKKRVSRV